LKFLNARALTIEGFRVASLRRVLDSPRRSVEPSRRRGVAASRWATASLHPRDKGQAMLKSVLLYLDEPAQAECVIRVGVNAARATQARVRGLTLVDTRWIAAVNQCESAASAVMAHEQCEVMKRDGAIVRKALSRECLNAGLNFDVRNIAGDPVEVLSREAHYHDLVVTSVTRRGSLSLAGTLGLVEHGVQPLLVVRP
jgi:hypothetical protein